MLTQKVQYSSSLVTLTCPPASSNSKRLNKPCFKLNIAWYYTEDKVRIEYNANK